MTTTPRFAQETRLRFLDGLLFWEGYANRRDLMETFQLSEPAAALDLKAYLALSGEGGVIYNTRQRRYEAAPGFVPVFGPPDPLVWLARSSTIAEATVLPTLDRPLDPALMALLHRAVRDRGAIRLTYQTMRRESAESRVITPTVFVSDTQRWHVRAFCHLRRDYRDFVLARMSDVAAADTVSVDLPVDVEWQTLVRLQLVPAPHLSASQKRAVRREYGMAGGHLEISLRRALETYATRRWGLDRPDSRLQVGRRSETAPGAVS